MDNMTTPNDKDREVAAKIATDLCGIPANVAEVSQLIAQHRAEAVADLAKHAEEMAGGLKQVDDMICQKKKLSPLQLQRIVRPLLTAYRAKYGEGKRPH